MINGEESMELKDQRQDSGEKKETRYHHTDLENPF